MGSFFNKKSDAEEQLKLMLGLALGVEIKFAIVDRTGPPQMGQFSLWLCPLNAIFLFPVNMSSNSITAGYSCRFQMRARA